MRRLIEWCVAWRTVRRMKRKVRRLTTEQKAELLQHIEQILNH